MNAWLCAAWYCACYGMRPSRQLAVDLLVLAILFLSFLFAFMAILGPDWTVQTWSDGTKTTENRAGLWRRCMSGICESYHDVSNNTESYLNTIRFSAITGAAMTIAPILCLQSCFALPFLMLGWFSEMSSILIFVRVRDQLLWMPASSVTVHSSLGESLWFMVAAYVSLGMGLVVWGWTRQCSQPPRMEESYDV